MCIRDRSVLGTQEHLKNPSITNVKNYHTQYYVPNNMAILLSGDFDPDQMAKELGIPEGTIHTWLKAVRAGTLDIGDGAHTPESAMKMCIRDSF